MKKKYRNFIWFTIVPFLIPFINELSDNIICVQLRWGIIIVAIGIDFWFSLKAIKEEMADERELFVQRSIRCAYSYAHELMESKRDTLSHDLEFNKINLKENILPYDIHLRIIDICRQFKNAISSITQINSEYVSCTLIYRYSYDSCTVDDQQWRWAGGRDPVTKLELNEFVEKNDTLYYQIIHGTTNFIYVAKKDELSSIQQYHLGNRDRMSNNVGSAFSVKIAFGNNSSPLVEGILTVSTCGKYFIDKMNIENADNVFQRMIIDDIFPYYKKLLELEFGMLYLRHTL